MPAPALIGASRVTAALTFGQDPAPVLQAFPTATLSALLLVAGITHVKLQADLRGAFVWTLP